MNTPASTPGSASFSVLAVVALGAAAMAAFWLLRGAAAGQQFACAYLVELSLSADNVLLFVLIFDRFGVPGAGRERALRWGVWGAAALRGAFLLAGIGLLRRFHPLTYLFGALLLVAGARAALGTGKGPGFDPLRLGRWLKAVVPVSDRYEGDRFVARGPSGRFATRLLAVLVIVEACDLFFALDSLPAVLAVTQDPLIAILSNLLAILALRSFALALAGRAEWVARLKPGLSAVLAFTGLRMLLATWVEIPVLVSLGFIAAALGASLLWGAVRG